MIPLEIRPFCNVCQMCRPSTDFNKTPNDTYYYTCKVCQDNIEREKARQQYEETKKKLEEQQQYQRKLSEDNTDYIVYHCPYDDCKLLSIVYKNEINCGIFRCGYNKLTNQQIPQHLPKIECDKLRNNPDIIGCARPYQLNTLTPMICDYI